VKTRGTAKSTSESSSEKITTTCLPRKKTRFPTQTKRKGKTDPKRILYKRTLPPPEKTSREWKQEGKKWVNGSEDDKSR